VVPPGGRPYRDLVARFVAIAGGTIEAPVEAEGRPLMLEFVRAGSGAAVVNGTCAPPRGVVLRRIPELGTVRYRVPWRAGAALSPAARLGVDLVRASARAGAHEPGS
jgi:DNA-binding transcriptional LysR family regulator